MNRIAAAFAVVVSLAVPALAQTNVDGATPGATSNTVTTPDPFKSATNLPGVDDASTTGNTGEASQEERCELPGTSGDSDTTAQVPSVRGADPTCR